MCARSSLPQLGGSSLGNCRHIFFAATFLLNPNARRAGRRPRINSGCLRYCPQNRIEVESLLLTEGNSNDYFPFPTTSRDDVGHLVAC